MNPILSGWCWSWQPCGMSVHFDRSSPYTDVACSSGRRDTSYEWRATGFTSIGTQRSCLYTLSVVPEHWIVFLEHLISVTLFLYRNILFYFREISLSHLYSRTGIFRCISGTLRFLFFCSCTGTCRYYFLYRLYLARCVACDFWDRGGGAFFNPGGFFFK